MRPHAAEPAQARKPTLLETALSTCLRLLPVKHGAHRLLDRLRPAAWITHPALVDVPYRGRIVRMDVSDLVGWHFFMLGDFDPEVGEVIRRFSLGDATDVFWDIGANKGALSYEVAASLPACKIVAIEPQKSMLRLLQENLEALASGRHEVFPVGLGETAAILELVIPAGNRGHASLAAAKQEAGSLVELVEVVTAQTLCEQSRYGWPTLVKIDVEGFEPPVIRSLLPAFQSQRIRCCVFECHASEENGFREIHATTAKFGYAIYAIRKTPFSTFLAPAPRLVKSSTDYVLIRGDLCARA